MLELEERKLSLSGRLTLGAKVRRGMSTRVDEESTPKSDNGSR